MGAMCAVCDLEKGLGCQEQRRHGVGELWGAAYPRESAGPPSHLVSGPGWGARLEELSEPKGQGGGDDFQRLSDVSEA